MPKHKPSRAADKLRPIVRRELSPARIEPCEMHFTITHAVWCGGTSVAYFDDLTRAALVRDAINNYRKTPDGRRWWAGMCKRSANT